MFKLDLNIKFKQTECLFKKREKFKKFKEIKMKIRFLKRKVNEIVEELKKKIESKKIEFFSNNLMQSIFISEKIVSLTVSS
jgi:transcriptional accessory protein Tex/SPT6